MVSKRSNLSLHWWFLLIVKSYTIYQEIYFLRKSSKTIGPKIVNFPHNQALKFACIAGEVGAWKKLGGTPSWGVKIKLGGRKLLWTMPFLHGCPLQRQTVLQSSEPHNVNFNAHDLNGLVIENIVSQVRHLFKGSTYFNFWPLRCVGYSRAMFIRGWRLIK